MPILSNKRALLISSAACLAVAGILSYLCITEYMSRGYPASFEIQWSRKSERIFQIGARSSKANVGDGKVGIFLSWQSGHGPVRFYIPRNVRIYSYYFQGLIREDVIPVHGRLYRLDNFGKSGSRYGWATLKRISSLEQLVSALPRPGPGIVIPIKGYANVDMYAGLWTMTVEEYKPAMHGNPESVRITISVPSTVKGDYYTRLKNHPEPIEKEYRVGDLLPIAPTEKIPVQVTQLRIHRIVAPDPAKHIPGWVELRFEPKDKPAPENSASEKPAHNQPEAKPQKP